MWGLAGLTAFQQGPAGSPACDRGAGVTILASHEYAESVNDPGLNAWYDADGDEHAATCHWVNLANGSSFPVEPFWSNQWRKQHGYGCYYS